MTIDYEALGEALWLHKWHADPNDPHVQNDWQKCLLNSHAQVWVGQARAVVAAMHDQGLIVLRRGDVESSLYWLEGHTHDMGDPELDMMNRLYTALAAAPIEGEDA